MNQMNKIVIIVSTGLVILIGGVLIFIITQPGRSSQLGGSDMHHQSSRSADDSKFQNLKGDAFDEAYIADMLAHHDGAVSMAEQAQAATAREDIRAFAGSIVQSQSKEIVEMRAWQKEWGYKVTASGGHGSHGGGNGMEDDMATMQGALEGLTGAAYDKEFLKQMILHHQQAVDMSQFAKANAKHQEIKDLAAAVIAAQEAEINQMKQWQREWGY